MKFLRLHFSGILQHYSSQSYGTIRGDCRTELFPTKASVVGLISSALGLSRGDEKIKYLYSTLNVKYKNLSKNQSVLTDFQSVKPLKSQNYYMNKMRPANGFATFENKTNEDNIIKRVEYLQDAKFDVFIGTDEELLKTIYDALRDPVYNVYFGRRNCIPNKPIVTEFKLIDEGELEDVRDCI